MYFFIFIIFFILVCILGFNGRMINQDTEKFISDTCLNYGSTYHKPCNGQNMISCNECL